MGVTEGTIRQIKRTGKILLGVFVLATLGWGCRYFVLIPQVVEAQSFDIHSEHNLQQPVQFTLDKPINKKKIQASITPAVPGEWSFEGEAVSATPYTVVKFTPTHFFAPDTAYTVQIAHISSVLGTQESSMTYNFRTPKQAGIVSSTPNDNAADVPICSAPVFTLDHPADENTTFSFTWEPAIPALLTQPKPGQYQLKPNSCLEQNQSYTVTAVRKLTLEGAKPENNYILHFHTKAAPAITAMTPQGNQILTSNKTLSLTFDQPMAAVDPAGKLALSPALAGSWKWDTPTTLTFTATTALAFDTRYTVTAKQGLPDAKDGFLPADVTYAFTTIGHAEVTALSPYRGTSEVPVGRAIAASFDQPVEASSAEQHFSISPAVDGSFSWQGNTMYFKGSLAKDTSYTVTLAAGIKSVNGLDSDRTYTTSFATEESVTLLSVPQHYQEKPLSCEVASLKMALAAKGVAVSEDELMNRVGYDSTPHDGDIWGDPDVGFVGSITGQQNTTGYGVHWGPIAAAGSAYRSTQAFRGWSVAELAQQIANGNPVVVWGVTGPATKAGWHTPAGKFVDAWRGEHVRVVVGFKGPADNPHSIILNDPSFGRLTWSVGTFAANWGTYGNSGVVIF